MKEFKPILSTITEYLSETESIEELNGILDDILDSYKTSEKLGLYPQNIPTFRTSKQYVSKLKENLKWAQVKDIIKLQTTSEDQKELEVLSNIDGSMVDNIYNVLTQWSDFIKAINPTIKQRLSSIDEQHIEELNAAVLGSNANIERAFSELKKFKGDEL